MKFLCERCNTRYSIGDDRVRGKILKIRCKTCGNVITVREGMTADGDAASVSAPIPVSSEPSRAKKATTIAPPAMDERRDRGAAMSAEADSGERATVRGTGAAGAGAVSRGARGASVGARGAVASALDADPGLAPAANPPPALEEEWYVSLDGEQAGPFPLAEAQRWVTRQPLEAELHCWREGFDDWLPIDKVSHFRGLRKRPNPNPPPLPRAAPAASARPSSPAAPSARATPPHGTQAGGRLGIARPGNGAPAAAPAGASGTSSSSGHSAISASFDIDMSDAADGQTQIEPIPFAPPPAAAPVPAAVPQLPDDDDLNIGEVSRVVNLADIARSRPSEQRRTNPAGVIANRAPGAAAAPGMRAATSPGISVAGSGAAESESAPIAPQIVHHHRRGLIALLVVAGLVVLGGVGAVIVFVTPGDDATGGRLGPVHDIDTSRPEDPVTHRPIEPPPAPVPIPTPPPVSPGPRTPPRTRTPSPPSGTAAEPSLSSDEIEDVARKHQEMTQRCYMRSQRGADSILIGEVKKIAVTLTIDRDGAVSELQLSEHGADTLGRCLSNAMKTWKFRPSPGGKFRFSLNFVSG